MYGYLFGIKQIGQHGHGVIYTNTQIKLPINLLLFYIYQTEAT